MYRKRVSFGSSGVYIAHDGRKGGKERYNCRFCRSAEPLRTVLRPADDCYRGQVRIPHGGTFTVHDIRDVAASGFYLCHGALPLCAGTERAALCAVVQTPPDYQILLRR